MIFTQLIKFRDLVSDFDMLLHSFQRLEVEKTSIEKLKTVINEKIQEIEDIPLEAEILQNTFDTDTSKRIKYQEFIDKIFEGLKEDIGQSYDLDMDEGGKPTGFLKPEKLDYETIMTAGEFDDLISEVASGYYRLYLQVERFVLISQNYNYGDSNILTSAIIDGKGITFKEKFVYLKELGFFDLKNIIQLPQNKKEIVISKILGCHIDYARDLITNNALKYSEDGKNGIREETVNKVKDYLNELKK